MKSTQTLVPAAGAWRAAAVESPAEGSERFVRLVGQLHAAHADPHAWHAALRASEAWLGCAEVFAGQATGGLVDPDALEAIAGRVTHCAAQRRASCAGRTIDAAQRARCAALAPHLHEAAASARDALRALLFDQLPAVWVLDAGGRVRDSNAPAKAAVAAGEPLRLHDGLLVPVVPGARAQLQQALADIEVEGQLSWPDARGQPVCLMLRRLPLAGFFSATLRPDPPAEPEAGRRLTEAFGLSARQAEVGAHLLAGRTLSAAARAMGISRDTANEHLAALLRRAGAADRASLLMAMRRVVTR